MRSIAWWRTRGSGRRRLMPSPIFFPNAAAFRAWLEAHAATATELVVGYRKVATGMPSMT